MVEEAKMGPPLRFQGFSDAWEQRKLGDLMTITSVKRIHQSDWTSSGVRFLRARDIVSAAKYEEPTDYLYISKEKYNEYSLISGKVTIGDLLVTGVGSIGVPLLITNGEPVYFKDGNVIWFKNNNVIDGNFYYYSFIHHKIQKFIKDVAGIGTVGTYTIDSGKKTPISLPIKKEQEKIGNLFKQLDDTIALHQRQSDNYKELKKSMLQKMFPQDGEKVPEVRFDGFTEEWERRSLNSIVKRVTRKNKNLESNLPLTISAQHGLVDQNTFFNKQVASKDVSGYYLVKKGEFAYNKSYSSGYPWGAIKRLDNYDMGVLSTLYIVFQPVNIISDFLVAYYDTNLWHKEVSMRAAEGARNHGLLNISAQDFFETELIISANTEEQARIGSYFKQLDDTIALHKQKITYLQILKNSLLNKMFI